MVKKDGAVVSKTKQVKIKKKKRMTAREREELLIENFVGIQHAMTNLSIKFEKLSDNMVKLLQIFEEAAKNFIQGGNQGDKDLLRKIDSLLEQNKTIASGLVLMEEKVRGRAQPQNLGIARPRPKPLPRI